MPGRAWGRLLLILLAVVLPVACADSGAVGSSPDPASSDAAATSSATLDGDGEDGGEEPSTTAESGRSAREDASDRYRFTCYADDGQVTAEVGSLEAVWASTQYLRTEYCSVEYVGSPPLTLTDSEAAVADIAGRGSEAEDTELYLDVLSACTRLAAEDGPHSLSETPEPVLEATLVLCPEAPHAGLIESQLGREAAP